MIFKNDEGKRNSIWKIVMSVSTVLIVIIAAFFIIKLFTANPLEGTWHSTDNGLTMTVNGDGTAEFEWQEEEGGPMKTDVKYKIDKEEKVFNLYTDESTGEGTDADSEEVERLRSTLDTSYDYSIEQEELTLTDREYGEQLVFEKQ